MNELMQDDHRRGLPGRSVGIVIGILLVATYFIPWGIYGGTKQWAWMLFKVGKPSPARTMLMAMWGIGLITFVSAIILSRARLAVVYLAAGIASVVFYLIGTRFSAEPWRTFVYMPLRHGFPVLLGVAIVGTLMVITGIGQAGRRPGETTLLRRIVAIAAAIVLVLSVFGEIRNTRQAGGAAESANWSIGVSIVAGWIAVIGCWVVFRDAGVSGDGESRGAIVGRRLVALGLLVKVVWSTARPAIDVGSVGVVFGSLNNMILLVSVSVLAITGLTGLFATAVGKSEESPLGEDQVGGESRPSRIVAVPATAVFRGRWKDVVASALTALVVAAVALGASRVNIQQRLIPTAVLPPRVGDWPQWCGGTDRNMVSGERGLPIAFDEVSNAKKKNLKNVKWVVRLTDHTLGSPIIHEGKVFVGGTGQNGAGVLWCFAEADGKMLWRMQLPYINDLYNRSFGITSTPTAQGKELYLVTHLGDVLCVSTEGLRGGNRGPFTDEANYFANSRQRTKNEIAPDGSRIVEWTPGEPASLGDTDADVIWRFDMVRQANCYPYNAVNSSPIIRGDDLFVATCSTYTTNQDGESKAVLAWKKQHDQAMYPSPSIIALDKKTGKLLAEDKQGIFEQTFHGSHSSPAMGIVNGKPLLVYGAGNGCCYAFDPNIERSADGKPTEIKLVWKFQCNDPATFSAGFSAERPAKSEIIATPVIYKDRVYVAIGNDLVNSGNEAKPGRLLCLDATQSGDVTHSAKRWSFDQMRSSASTVAIADGLLYTADASGVIYCLDAETGKLQWTHSTQATSTGVWASPLVADGKVYVPVHEGGLLIFAQGREKKLLAHLMGNKDLISSPAAANGVLYITTQRNLYALKEGCHGGLTKHEE